MRSLPVDLVQKVSEKELIDHFLAKEAHSPFSHLVTARDVANVLLSSAPIVTRNTSTLLKEWGAICE